MTTDAELLNPAPVERTPAMLGLERALAVIYHVARSPEKDVGVSEVARALGLSKAVAYRILATLSADGFLAVDDATRRYALGPGALVVGIAALGRLDLRGVARRWLERLSRETGETATLSVRLGDERMYVDQVLSSQEIKMSVQLGRPFPLHAGGSSKAILAALPAAERDAYIDASSLKSFTERTIVDPRKLRTAIEDVRRHGYAQSAGERESGAASVAAPVFGHDGAAVGSISICGPIQRFGPDEYRRYGHLVLDVARTISEELGWTDVWPPTPTGNPAPDRE